MTTTDLTPLQAQILAAVQNGMAPRHIDHEFGFGSGHASQVIFKLRRDGHLPRPTYKERKHYTPGKAPSPAPAPRIDPTSRNAVIYDLVHGKGFSVRQAAATMGIQQSEVFRALAEHNVLVLAVTYRRPPYRRLDDFA